MRCVWTARRLRIRLVVISSTVDGAKQRSLTIAIAIDQVRRIRRMAGTGLIDCVYCMEVVGMIVDVDGNTRKLRKALFIGSR